MGIKVLAYGLLEGNDKEERKEIEKSIDTLVKNLNRHYDLCLIPVDKKTDKSLIYVNLMERDEKPACIGYAVMAEDGSEIKGEIPLNELVNSQQPFHIEQLKQLPGVRKKIINFISEKGHIKSVDEMNKENIEKLKELLAKIIGDYPRELGPSNKIARIAGELFGDLFDFKYGKHSSSDLPSKKAEIIQGASGNKGVKSALKGRSEKSAIAKSGGVKGTPTKARNTRGAAAKPVTKKHTATKKGKALKNKIAGDDGSPADENLGDTLIDIGKKTTVENTLYKVTARHIVILFTAFKQLNSLNHSFREIIKDTFLQNSVLSKEGLDQHLTMDIVNMGEIINLDLAKLKNGVKQFAYVDESDKSFKMKKQGGIENLASNKENPNPKIDNLIPSDDTDNDSNDDPEALEITL